MSELETIARGLLKQRKPTDAVSTFVKLLRKRDDLLNALALDYLTRLGAGQAMSDVQTVHAAPETGAGHLVGEPPCVPAGSGSIPKIKVSEHHVQEHRRRTPEQIEAEKRARMLMADAVFESRLIDNRPIGDLRYGELTRLREVHALNAASWLRQGTEATENAILVDKMFKHAHVADTNQCVREFLTAKTLAMMIDEARTEAPRLVERGMQIYREQIERYDEIKELYHAQA